MKFTLLFLLFSFASISQVTSSSLTKADILVISSEYAEAGRVTDDMRSRFPINYVKGRELVSFVARVNNNFAVNTLTEKGAEVGSRIGDIISLRYPVEILSEIDTETGLSYIKTAAKIKPNLDRVAIGTHADSVWAGIGLPQGYTGKDVIIGITDWGFDYTSPMFYDTLLQNTRILAAWDQFKLSGNPPIGYTYGAEYDGSAELLTAQSDTANIYSYHTHGNHVAGIAGGSGAGLEYRGMAFESEFLFVTFRFDESYVLDAWQWMFNKAQAEAKPLVVNMSWGIYHMGAVDGTDILSQAIDSYTSQGVLFVTSAGNNGGTPFHSEYDFAADTVRTRVGFYTNQSTNGFWGQSFHAWGDTGNEFTMRFVVSDNSNNFLAYSPWYSTATQTSYVDSFLVVTGTDSVFYNLAMDAAYPSNGRPQARMRLKYTSLPYRLGVEVTAPTGHVHFWNLTELTTDVGNWGMPLYFWAGNSISGDDQYGIGVPACSPKALTVGAYTSEFYTPTGNLVGGQEASFSSYGPLMNEELKPDVSAPGVNVISSISSFTDASFGQVDFVDFMGRTYPFASFSGTSMSSPACAGVAALIWDSNPYLTAAQVKNVIIQSARIDQYTGTIPPHSRKWGWGKVDAYQAVKWAVNITGLQEVNKTISWSVYPNPVNDELNVTGVNGNVTNVRIISMNGTEVRESDAISDLSVENLDAGTYLLRLVIDGKVEQKKFIKQ